MTRRYWAKMFVEYKRCGIGKLSHLRPYLSQVSKLFLSRKANCLLLTATASHVDQVSRCGPCQSPSSFAGCPAWDDMCHPREKWRGHYVCSSPRSPGLSCWPSWMRGTLGPCLGPESGVLSWEWKAGSTSEQQWLWLRKLDQCDYRNRKRLQARTCYLEYGEHHHLIEQSCSCTREGVGPSPRPHMSQLFFYLQ